MHELLEKTKQCLASFFAYQKNHRADDYLQKAAETLSNARRFYENAKIKETYNRLVVLPTLSLDSFLAKNPIKASSDFATLSGEEILSTLNTKIEAVISSLEELAKKTVSLDEKTVFAKAKAIFQEDADIQLLFKVGANTIQKEIKAKDAKLGEEEKKAKEEVSSSIKTYNGLLSNLILSNDRIMPNDFPADYELPILSQANSEIEALNTEIDGLDTSFEKAMAWDVVSLKPAKEEGRLVFLNEKEEDLIAAYRRIAYQFILSYPSKFKQILAIHAKSGSPLFEFMSKIGTLGKGALLFGADKRSVHTTSEEIQAAIAAVNEKINKVSEKLGIGGYKNVYEYNQANQDNPEPLLLILFHQCPQGIDNPSLKDGLLNLFSAGPRCGVIPVIGLDESLIPTGYSATYAQELAKELKEQKGVLRPKFGPTYPLPIDGEYDENAFLAALNKDLAKGDRPILLQDVLPPEDFATSPRRKEFSKVLRIPVGKASGKIQELVLDASGKTHVIIEGGTGSGKTNFARALIMAACSLYSPEELEIELFDFKDGLGFKQFADEKLKHVRFVSFNNKIDDARDVIQYIDGMISERNRIISSYPGTDTLDGYNKQAVADGKKPIPRMIVVLDEYQEITGLDDCLAALESIARKGRAAGISLILSSQDVPKMSAFDRIKQLLDHRFVFQASPQNIAALIPAMEKRAEELSLIKGLAAYDQNVNRPLLFRSTYAGNDQEIPAAIAKINNLYPNIKANIEQVGESLPIYVNDVAIVPQKEKGEAKRAYIEEGEVEVTLGEYAISKRPATIAQNEKNPVLFLVGEYVKAKDIVASILLSDLRALKGADIKAPSSMIRIVDFCDSSRKIRRENPLQHIFAKKADLEESGVNSLSYFDYFEREQFPDVVSALQEVAAAREKDADDRDPMFIFLLCLDDYGQQPLAMNDALASLISKGKKLDIYFVLQMESANCEFFRNFFRSSRTSNGSLVKDAVVLSDGRVEFTSPTQGSKEIEPSLTVRTSLEAFSNVLSGQVISSYIKAIDANPLDPSFAFVIDDGAINKIKYHVFREDFAETLAKEFTHE